MGRKPILKKIFSLILQGKFLISWVFFSVILYRPEMISSFLVGKYAASSDSSGYSVTPTPGLSCLKLIVIAAFWKTLLETDGNGASFQDCEHKSAVSTCQ